MLRLLATMTSEVRRVAGSGLVIAVEAVGGGSWSRDALYERYQASYEALVEAAAADNVGAGGVKTSPPIFASRYCCRAFAGLYA